MSISQSQLSDFCRVMLNHEAYDEVMSRVNKRLYTRWLKGTEVERKIIGDIHDAGELFKRELNTVVSELKDITGDSNE